MTIRLLEPVVNLWPGHDTLPAGLRRDIALFFDGYKSEHPLRVTHENFHELYSEALVIRLNNPMLAKARTNYSVSLRYVRGLGSPAQWYDHFDPRGLSGQEQGSLVGQIARMHDGHGAIFERYAIYPARSTKELDQACTDFHARVSKEIANIAAYIETAITGRKQAA